MKMPHWSKNRRQPTGVRDVKELFASEMGRQEDPSRTASNLMLGVLVRSSFRPCAVAFFGP